MGKRRIITILVLVLGFLLVGLDLGLAAEEPVKPENFYRGNTIKLINATRAGTGIDLAVRTTTPFLKEYTGAKVVIVENKSKGSGLEGVNAVRVAKPDGLTLGSWQVLSATMNELMDAQGWKEIKMEEVEFVMGFPLEPHLFSVTPGGPYQTVSQLQAGKSLKLAGHGPGSNMTMVACTLAEVFNLDAKVIIGIAGVGNVAKSVMQGETNGTAMPLSTGMRYANQGQLKPMFVVASQRHKSAPDIPAITELIKNMTPEKKALIELWEERLLLSTVIWTTPGAPKDRVDYLRQISRKIASDPEFQKDLKKLYRYDLSGKDFPTGEETEKRIKETIKDKKQIQELLIGLLKKYR